MRALVRKYEPSEWSGYHGLLSAERCPHGMTVGYPPLIGCSCTTPEWHVVQPSPWPRFANALICLRWLMMRPTSLTEGADRAGRPRTSEECFDDNSGRQRNRLSPADYEDRSGHRTGKSPYPSSPLRLYREANPQCPVARGRRCRSSLDARFHPTFIRGRDSTATGTECRLTRKRDGHSAKRDGTCKESQDEGRF